MEIFVKVLAIIFSLCILLNAYFIKRAVKTWLFPGIIFSLFWFAYTFPPLVFLFHTPISPFPILFISILVIIFSWTAVFFDWNLAYRLNTNKISSPKVFQTKRIRLILKYSIVLSILFSILQVQAQDISIYEMITNPLGVSGKYAAKRYNDGLNDSKFYVLSLVFAYMSVLVGGLYYGSSKILKIKILSLLCLIPSVIVMFTQGSKGLFFLSVFLFLGSIMITKFHDNKLDLFTSKTWKSAFKAFMLIFVMTIFSFKSRGMQNISDFETLYRRISFYFRSYAFGHLYAFSDWFTAYFNEGKASQEYLIDNNYLGYYTFRIISRYYVPQDILNTKGIYDEYFEQNEVLKSNIYTMFRGLIMDFGILGSIVFMFINGLIIHSVFYYFLLKKNPCISSAFLVFTVGYFYISYIISMLNWNVILFSFVMFVLVLVFNKYKFIFKS